MSVVGNWRLTMDTPFGVQTPLLTVRQDGGAYSGTLAGATGEAVLADLKVEDSKLSFTATATTPMGDFDVSYRATVEGNAINGTYKTMMGINPFTGVRQ